MCHGSYWLLRLHRDFVDNTGKVSSQAAGVSYGWLCFPNLMRPICPLDYSTSLQACACCLPCAHTGQMYLHEAS